VAAQALFAWRGELLNALGGPDNVSPQKAALVETCVRTRLFIDHVDAFLLEQHSLINRKKKTMIPILRERTQLCDSLTKTLCHLGLERVAAPLPSLGEYLDSPQHKAAVAAAMAEEAAYRSANEAAPDPSPDAGNAPPSGATPAINTSDEGEPS
jgi:hypothetical protein